MEGDQHLKWHILYHLRVNEIILLGAINSIHATFTACYLHKMCT